MDINTGSEADRIGNLEHRVGQLEALVTQLQQQVNASLPPYGPPQVTLAGPGLVAPAVAGQAAPWMAEVQALVAAGQKIDAIKAYRQATGVGLAEAKDAVDGLG